MRHNFRAYRTSFVIIRLVSRFLATWCDGFFVHKRNTHFPIYESFCKELIVASHLFRLITFFPEEPGIYESSCSIKMCHAKITSFVPWRAHSQKQHCE